MGCTGTKHFFMKKECKALQKKEVMGSAERAMKAALLIQRWYRRYLARQEIRKRCSWNIFQSLEYAGEQDQMKLQNFFHDLLTHLSNIKPSVAAAISNPNPAASLRGLEPLPKDQLRLAAAEAELYRNTDPNEIIVEDTYRGAHLEPPFTSQHVNQLIQSFKERRTLHARYVLTIIHEARYFLRQMPNLSTASTAFAKQITVVGDLHGKLDDLLTVFYKNGLPSKDNPYVFNGDFVDRGIHSVEVLMLLLLCMLVWKDCVFLNRGNHEDFNVNLRYGFLKEIMYKYTRQAPKIIQATEDLYSWLPLGTLIDNKVLVVHGGVSSTTDLKAIATVDRHQFATVLQAPGQHSNYTYREWRQVVDLLWSDPRTLNGCQPNNLRGGGSFFGPDVTEAFLRKYDLQLIIRSHECKVDGYEFTHNGKVLTIFSASNYYDVGSNRGAYVKLCGPKLVPHAVMFVSTAQTRKATIQQRSGLMEHSALRELKHHIFACQSLLKKEFQRTDPNKTGTVKVSDWCDIMERTVGLKVTWRLLCPKIAQVDPIQGLVHYESTFDEYYLTNALAQGGPTFLESLYRNKEALETIFRIMDKDGSGLISMQEFQDACDLLGQHAEQPMSREHIEQLAKSIDINKDGFIDFNEFLEAFRLVDKTPSLDEKSPDQEDRDSFDQSRNLQESNGGIEITKL
ncbi:serine/threonine-protein phosphatase with EF-hands 2-like isoform X2 [Varroa jacobsoni]|uniref:serine/threonine-protein phosphatase with EF-hands 2-like isoform X2 n=1 Tax=Varroa jacobsoni TaxID=62625 RepID=UPI000BF698C2|nr:serine/threonine-protein phosphatase with EF-hands 2-like isoform X2 [Varroa jacobsoni]